MKKSIHQTTLTKIAARAARHLATAALLIAIIVALPRLACAQAVETTLASFDGTNGHYPTQGLLLASDGNFYGTTPSYGADYGTVFRITPTGTLTTIYRFSGSGRRGQPAGGADPRLRRQFIRHNRRGFWDLPIYGTVFKLTLDGTLTTLFAFTYDPTTDTFPNGLSPRGGAGARTRRQLLWHDRRRREPTWRRQSHGHDFQDVARGRSAGFVLRSMEVADIAFPNAPLVLGTDGAFYSTSYNSGGGLGSGAVYQFSAAGVVTVLHGFNDTPDGNMPNGGLVLGSDGNFYGTTEYGGTSHLGTAYRISPEGTYEELISFDSSNGAQPFGQMIQATDGNFYGTTLGGGSHFDGTVFQLTPAGVLTTVYNFTFSGSGDTDGAGPKGTLVQGADRRLYGTTQGGGLYGLGTVFALDLNLANPLTLLSAASVKGGFAIDLPLTGTPGIEDRCGRHGADSITMTFNNNLTSVGGITSSCGTVVSGVIDSTNPHQFIVNLQGGQMQC